MFNAINFSLAPALPNMGLDMMGNVILPALNIPDNLTATQTRIGMFSCPSDYTLNNWPGTNSYVVNQGGWMYNSASNTGTVGPFSDGSAVTVAAITDGMSQTAFASERLLGSGIINQDLSGWYMYMQSPMPTTADQTYATCQGLAPQMIWYNQTGAVWASGEMPNTTYNHVAPPNGRSCAIMNGGQMMAPWSGDAMDLPGTCRCRLPAPPGWRECSGRGRFSPVREELSVRANLASLGIKSWRRGHIIGRLLSELIMRVLGSLLPMVFLIVVTLGSPVLVGGCSNNPTPSKAQIDANKREQELLHDQMQKGFAKRPATKRR